MGGGGDLIPQSLVIGGVEGVQGEGGGREVEEGSLTVEEGEEERVSGMRGKADDCQGGD